MENAILQLIRIVEENRCIDHYRLQQYANLLGIPTQNIIQIMYNLHRQGKIRMYDIRGWYVFCRKVV